MQNSSIEWTDHTFNPWWGCMKVSDGCKNCYALTLSKRFGHDIWGPAATTHRRMMSDNYWRQPLKWNAAAAKAGVRPRVFCASMADVFEEHPEVVEARRRLFKLILDTPNLDWLLLTKRPENMTAMTPAEWRGGWPTNVWAMTSVENQEQADKRIPALLKVPARVRGLSCEPLLGPVNLTSLVEHVEGFECVTDSLRGIISIDGQAHLPLAHTINWVIAGGESGHGARPMHLNWARSLRDQCAAAGVPFHFKQWGEFAPYDGQTKDSVYIVRHDGSHEKNYTSDVFGDEELIERVGKHAAGRLLDGRIWDEMPV